MSFVSEYYNSDLVAEFCPGNIDFYFFFRCVVFFGFVLVLILCSFFFFLSLCSDIINLH